MFVCALDQKPIRISKRNFIFNFFTLKLKVFDGFVGGNGVDGAV